MGPVCVSSMTNIMVVYGEVLEPGMCPYGEKYRGNCNISPTHYHQLIITNLFCHSRYLISSFGLIGSTIFLLATFAISPKHFVAFLKSPKYFGYFLYHHFLHLFWSPYSCSISISPKLFFISDKMCGLKTTKSPILCLYHQNLVDK